MENEGFIRWLLVRLAISARGGVLSSFGLTSVIVTCFLRGEYDSQKAACPNIRTTISC